MELSKEQAINVLTQACNQYRGTWEEHQVLRQALHVLSKPAVSPDPKATSPEPQEDVAEVENIIKLEDRADLS